MSQDSISFAIQKQTTEMFTPADETLGNVIIYGSDNTRGEIRNIGHLDEDCET
jgi:hypothetical protein